jgi:RNA polymerase sigma factor (sigma-70 family)
MSHLALHSLIGQLRRVVGPPAGLAPAPSPTDAELLERFVHQRDAAAFELLVWRHQRLVFGVCRRVLRDLADAEDAFQATFLALVRKAGSISKRQALAGWLYQVAHRIACRAQVNIGRRARRELGGTDLTGAPDRREGVAGDDLWQVLDRELQRLPAKYREPIVLCYLEGKTYDEAAQHLGCGRGTISTRLTRARELLRARLTRRGLTLSATAMATALCEQAAAAGAPATLVAATLQTITSPGGAVPVTVAALTDGALQAMFWSKMKTYLGVTVVTAIFGVSGALLWPNLGPTAQAQDKGSGGVLVAPSDATQDTWRLRTTLELGDENTIVTISPDGKTLAAAGGNKTARVRLWDVTSGKEIANVRAQDRTIRSVTFSPDGRQLVTGGLEAAGQSDQERGLITVWDVASKKIVTTVTDPQAPVVLVQVKDDRLIAVNSDGILRILDPRGKEARWINLAATELHVAAMSPDQKVLAVVQADGTVSLVDLGSGTVTRRLLGLTETPSAIAFSPDGKRLAVTLGKAKKARAVHLWDVDTGKGILDLNDRQTIRSLAFSPDGKVLATGGDDRTVRLWDLATGKELALLGGHDGPVVVVIFSADGRFLATGGDRTVRIWEMATAKAPAEADSGVSPRLTSLVGALLKTKKSDEQIIEALCLATLARLPADAEAKLMLKHLAGAKDRREALLDVVHALVSSLEFRANVEELSKQGLQLGGKK